MEYRSSPAERDMSRTRDLPSLQAFSMVRVPGKSPSLGTVTGWNSGRGVGSAVGIGPGVELPFMAANTEPRPGRASVSWGWVVFRRAAKVTASTDAAAAMLLMVRSTGRCRTGSVSGRLSRVFWMRRCMGRGTSTTPYSLARAALKARSRPMWVRGPGLFGSRGSLGCLSGFFICFISATVNPPPLLRRLSL